MKRYDHPDVRNLVLTMRATAYAALTAGPGTIKARATSGIVACEIRWRRCGAQTYFAYRWFVHACPRQVRDLTPGMFDRYKTPQVTADYYEGFAPE